MATYWITVSGISEELIRLAIERHEEKQKLNIQSNKRRALFAGIVLPLCKECFHDKSNVKTSRTNDKWYGISRAV